MDDLGSATTSGIVDISVVPDTLSSIAIFNPLISGSNFTFSFATQLGQAYVVQAADSSIDPGWNAVTNVTGTGMTFTVADPITTAQRFYRVINP